MSNGNSNLDSSTSTDSEHITTLLHSKMTLAYSGMSFPSLLLDFIVVGYGPFELTFVLS